VTVLAIVPARAGSKGVPGKNIHPLAGQPLLAYSIVAGLRCAAIDRVLLSTDSEQLAAVGKAYGAEVPFLRPADLATDSAADIGYVRHALDWLSREEGWRPDLVVQLRPTTPLRDPEVIAAAIRALQADPEATALRSAHQLAEPPQKMLQIVDNRFAGFFPDDPRPEYFNLPRQSFPAAYQPNGYVDICRAALVEEMNQLYGAAILPFVTEWSAEIDSAEDLELLEWQLSRRQHPLVDMVTAAKQRQERN
jgi:CMP-N,N'-diacetyllegionaminic acid synthase